MNKGKAFLAKIMLSAMVLAAPAAGTQVDAASVYAGTAYINGAAQHIYVDDTSVVHKRAGFVYQSIVVADCGGTTYIWKFEKTLKNGEIYYYYYKPGAKYVEGSGQIAQGSNGRPGVIYAWLLSHGYAQ